MLKIKTFTEFCESYKDLGKLTPSELIKGQPLDSKSTFNEVNGRTFHNIISKIKDNDIAKGDKAKGLDTLSVYNISEYNEMKCYIGENNSSGFALKDTEIVSVFSSQKSSGIALMREAIRLGGNHLDCFALRDSDGNISGSLYSLYTRVGFKIDTSLNSGDIDEPYSIINGISSYVENGKVYPNDQRIVIYMKL